MQVPDSRFVCGSENHIFVRKTTIDFTGIGAGPGDNNIRLSMGSLKFIQQTLRK